MSEGVVRLAVKATCPHGIVVRALTRPVMRDLRDAILTHPTT